MKISGFEARAAYQPASGLNGRFALAYADGEVRSPGSPAASLSTIDPLNAVLGIGYRAPGRRFGGEIIATYNARKEANETIGVCTATCFRPGEFVILDATAFFNVTDQLTLRAGLFNITDRTYAYWNDVRGLTATSTITDAFTQPGRNVSVSASLKF